MYMYIYCMCGSFLSECDLDFVYVYMCNSSDLCTSMTRAHVTVGVLNSI